MTLLWDTYAYLFIAASIYLLLKWYSVDTSTNIWCTCFIKSHSSVTNISQIAAIFIRMVNLPNMGHWPSYETQQKTVLWNWTNSAQNKPVIGDLWTQNDRRHDFWIIMEPQYTLLYTLDANTCVRTLYKTMCQENVRYKLNGIYQRLRFYQNNSMTFLIIPPVS